MIFFVQRHSMTLNKWALDRQNLKEFLEYAKFKSLLINLQFQHIALLALLYFTQLILLYLNSVFIFDTFNFLRPHFFLKNIALQGNQ